MSLEVGARRSLVDLAAEPYDVLVVGGGIVGAGVVRDAALRGLRSLLIEQADFASGTSSRSSRLLHGGLRYLAQGHVGLVREASVEKMRLSRNAPHLCQPLPFVFPAWRGAGWPKWQLSIGVQLYDALCGRTNLGESRSLSAEEVAEAVPGIDRTDLLGGTRHFDALTSDSRLVLDTLLSAAACGAEVRNYTEFVAATPDQGRWRCMLLDSRMNETCVLFARTVVNAAGAWANRLPPSSLRLRLTKGVHLVIGRGRLPLDSAVILPEGRRILFVIPWGERVILGTTDTDFDGDPGTVRTDAADVAYVLGVVNRAFPGVGLGAGDVLATWAGVRPLIAPKTTEAGAPSDVSRGHLIRMTEPGWFDVAGGKLTTYRRMAEETVGEIGRHLNLRLPASPTAGLPLIRGEFSGVVPPAVEPWIVAESCRKEWALHLDDVMLRRTSWHYYRTDALEVANHVAQWMGETLGWNAAERQSELDRYLRVVDSPPGVSSGRPGP